MAKNISNAKSFIFLHSSRQFKMFQRGNDVEEIGQKYIIFCRCQKNVSSWQMYIINEKIIIFFYNYKCVIGTCTSVVVSRLNELF